MGMVVPFHGCAPSAGYKSGRRSWRETPDTRSTARTRKGGTSSHCETACLETPSSLASGVSPPAASIARFKDCLRSDMAIISSTAEHQSQAWLNCASKGRLYNVGVEIGARIKAARARLRPKVTQQQIADLFGITAQAVSMWEAGEAYPDPDRYPQLRQILRVTYVWLLQGEGPPPDPLDPMVLLEDRLGADYGAVGAKKGNPATRVASRR